MSFIKKAPLWKALSDILKVKFRYSASSPAESGGYSG
jgi:hypothetical protein